MTYAKGGNITAADYNALVGPNNVIGPYASSGAATSKVAALYGVGYGDRGYGQKSPSLDKKTAGNPNEPLWLCRPSGDNQNDGGWNTSHFTIDSTKKYRSTIWFRVLNTSGSIYHGLSGAGNTYDLGGGNNTNPYWMGHSVAAIGLIPGQWYLSVGIVHEASYAGGYSGISGLYDINGNKVSNHTEYRMAPGATGQMQRAYHYYDSDSTQRQWMARPRFEQITGSEPTIGALLVASYDGIAINTLVTPSQWTPGITPNVMTSVGMFQSNASVNGEDTIIQANTPGNISGPTGSIVRAQDFIDLRTAIATIANYQGTAQSTNPPNTEFVPGSPIKAEVSATTAYDFQTVINAIDAARLNANPANMSLVNGAISSTRSASWGTSGAPAIGAEFEMTFPSENDARFFFNSGGTLNMNLSHANTSSTQDSNWNSILSALGTVSLGARTTTRSGSGGTPAALGYYNLTTSAQSIFSGNIGTGAYASNSINITAWVVNVGGVNGGNGTAVRMKVVLTDGHANAFSDTVASGTAASMGYRKASTYITGIATPTFAVTIQF